MKPQLCFFSLKTFSSLYCGKWRKISKSHHDLDLDPTMPIIKLDIDILVYYNLFKFHGPKMITF